MDKAKIEIKSISGNEHTVRKLINMLAWMEVCGSIGHSTGFQVGFDGDGAAQFKIDFGEHKAEYENLKKELLEQYRTTGDIKSFAFD